MRYMGWSYRQLMETPERVVAQIFELMIEQGGQRDRDA